MCTSSLFFFSSFFLSFVKDKTWTRNNVTDTRKTLHLTLKNESKSISHLRILTCLAIEQFRHSMCWFIFSFQFDLFFTTRFYRRRRRRISLTFNDIRSLFEWVSIVEMRMFSRRCHYRQNTMIISKRSKYRSAIMICMLINCLLFCILYTWETNMMMVVEHEKTNGNV
jgi:amino acid permease